MRDIEDSSARRRIGFCVAREKMKNAVRLQKTIHGREKFLFLGNEYELQIVKPQRPALKFDGAFTLGETAQKRGGGIHPLVREQALQIMTERVNHYSTLHGFAPRQVKVNSAKTRWGSCTSTGTVNFTWRLVMAPLEVIDYVVLHELAHLKIKNHSPRFWKLVESLCPEFKRHRKWLRGMGGLSL
ncbi:MAG: M48 family metallopeptidase [Anaerolineales bacterium]|nr:M48 family metallopeptidase [Anaerolineales bacterium]